MKKLKQHPQLILLMVALVMCLISGIVANRIVTSNGRVDVSNAAINTDAGTITGYLLVPDGVTSANPAPGIVIGHSATSSVENVDSWYVELSRRGYVVLAVNLFGHGDSDVADEAYADTITYTSNGLYDAVEYLYAQPFVDKENVALMGHSLGGGSTLKVAQYYTDLENEALANGATAEEAHAFNKLTACLSIGYPLEVKLPGFEAMSSEDFLGYNCDVGVILGTADDFNAWLTNDILTNETGRSWLKMQTGVVADAVEEGRFYTNPETGYRFAMWNTAEIHSQHTISVPSTQYVIDFFEETIGAPNPIRSTNQTWYWKQIFNFIGMIGFFLFIIPCLFFVLKYPAFQSLERENTFILPPLLGKERNKYLRAIITGALINTVLFIPLVLVGMLAMNSTVLPESSTNGFVLWGIACGLITLFSVRRGTGLKYKQNTEYYGFKTTWWELLKMFAMCLTVICLSFSTVFIVKYLFNTDFRLWSYAIRPFTANRLTIMIRYLPLFFVLQFANGVAIRRNNFDNWSDKKRIAFSTTMALLPIAIMLAITYLPILFVGMPTFGLDGSNMLLLASAQATNKLISYIFSIGITAAIHVKAQKYTGNIWAGAFINAMMICVITVSNTSTISMF